MCLQCEKSVRNPNPCEKYFHIPIPMLSLSVGTLCGAVSLPVSVTIHSGVFVQLFCTAHFIKSFQKMSYFILSYCNYIYSIHSARKRDTSTTMVYCLAEVNTEALLQLLAKGKHKFCQTVIHISSNETRLHEVTKINIESTFLQSSLVLSLIRPGIT